jgi:hypothetical protein
MQAVISAVTAVPVRLHQQMLKGDMQPMPALQLQKQQEHL